MSRLIILTALFLFFQAEIMQMIQSQDDYQINNDCPPTRCGDSGLEIGFPLALNSSPHYCTNFDYGLNLYCSSNHTLISFPSLGSYNVTAIDYRHSYMEIFQPLLLDCPWLGLEEYYRSVVMEFPIWSPAFILMNCSSELTSGSEENEDIFGPISCLSDHVKGYFVYAVNASININILPSDCMNVFSGGLPYGQPDGYLSFRALAENFSRKPEVSTYVDLSDIFDTSTRCQKCLYQGNTCGLSRARNKSFCIDQRGSDKSHVLHVLLITGLSIAGVIILASVGVMYFISRISDKEKETRLKVEQFLATYETTKLTRYTYTSIRKITKKFKHKLGQGGYGSVYKGELSNGIPVAIKMLEISESDGQEFINEVSTIGRIHHVNVVHLLGFCSEGTRRALVYEFMPNKSLDKFIFSSEAKMTHRPFSMEKLYDISIGIAQGIEYLHQGCNQRILHFDIKPHNILLDYDFNPKISDFGLSKISPRDQSIVSMTTARGTMGYIAPEIYSRNFGTVSSKSDVYSFGMLIFEMISGRKNVDPSIGNDTEAYFPECIYDWLVRGENLGLAIGMDCDEEIVQKLTIIALWCIQWSPAERPSMTRVVQMLMGNLQSLQIPPKPFVSLSNQ